MESDYVFIEPCAGSAAMTRALYEYKQQILPYQGSKWTLRAPYLRLFRDLGYLGPPSQAYLYDVSPLAEAVALAMAHPQQVLEYLGPLVSEGTARKENPKGPSVLYNRLHRGVVPENRYERAAQLLWLQRMSWSGKAVGTSRVGGRLLWKSQGLNTTSAYGKEGTETFGAIRPMGEALLEVVSQHKSPVLGYWRPLNWNEDNQNFRSPRRLVFLDPPYLDSTPYPCGSMSRQEVVTLALELQSNGCTVVVCEASPIPELEASGWSSRCIQAARGSGRGRMQTKKRTPGCRGAEWVMYKTG